MHRQALRSLPRLHGAEESESRGGGLSSVKWNAKCYAGRRWSRGRPGRESTPYFSFSRSMGNSDGRQR
jgi:hypothetical protein